MGDPLAKRLLGIFAEELEDHVQSIEKALLALERTGEPVATPELTEAMFRAAHSLKGAAHAVDIGAVESLCHQLESILAAVRNGQAVFGPALVQLLFSVTDALAEAGRRIRDETGLDSAALARLTAQLTESGAAMAAKPAPVAKAAPPAAGAAAASPVSSVPTGPEPPVSIRLPVERLDRILTLSGELLVSRHRQEAQIGRTARTAEEIKGLQIEWRRLRQSLQPLLRPDVNMPSAGSDRRRVRTQASHAARITDALDRHGVRLQQIERQLQELETEIKLDAHVMEQTRHPLDAEIRRLRMRPFPQACLGLDRMVRDLAHRTAKQAVLSLEGGDIELDQSILQGLTDPLRHLVRNAVVHGMEPPAARRAAGKPDQGRITVSAALTGSSVKVTVADDGRGLDVSALRNEMRRKRLIEPADDREVLDQIFAPGISTASQLDELSGRGMGLDIVRRAAYAMRGRVDVAFEAGRGTVFTLTLPLTVATIRALLVAAAGQTFALDMVAVRRLLRHDTKSLAWAGGRRMLATRETAIPLHELATVLGIRGEMDRRERKMAPVVVLTDGETDAAFVVDEVITEQEILVRGLGPRLQGVAAFSGAALLPSGNVVPIINAIDLIGSASRRDRGVDLPAMSDNDMLTQRKRLLLVDDSLTTRTLEKSILENAGYDVLVAADGAAAWRLLQERGADLVVTDVEMPHMDGFQLTEAIRASRRFRELPVILVTGRGSDEDRARGLAAGANAYLPKQSFDAETLVGAIADIL
ncbi:MAG: two-component system, chemotaxis family, sensor kinase CheA [Rhodospirillaceae bacterium]|nr:two-component system, chemotaxis family, sensor kinase CheA [Rhodospirillaceae bacterium]